MNMATVNLTSTSTARIQRIDGWTPDRIRTFLCSLAGGASVSDAARAAGMSRQGAYAFRVSPNGRSFDAAWRAAQLLASRRRRRAVMARYEEKRLRRARRYAPEVRRVPTASALRHWLVGLEAG